MECGIIWRSVSSSLFSLFSLPCEPGCILLCEPSCCLPITWPPAVCPPLVYNQPTCQATLECLLSVYYLSITYPPPVHHLSIIRLLTCLLPALYPTSLHRSVLYWQLLTDGYQFLPAGHSNDIPVSSY